jgi:hypothetical protein
MGRRCGLHIPPVAGFSLLDNLWSTSVRPRTDKPEGLFDRVTRNVPGRDAPSTALGRRPYRGGLKPIVGTALRSGQGRVGAGSSEARNA